jgi:hypothetical protein
VAKTTVDLAAFRRAASTFADISGTVGRFAVSLDEAPLHLPADAWGHPDAGEDDLAHAYDELRRSAASLLRDGGAVLDDIGATIHLAARRFQDQEDQASEELHTIGRQLDD